MKINPDIEMFWIDFYPEKNKEQYKKVYKWNILEIENIVDEQFDLVICFHVLEHIPVDKVNWLIKSVNKILKVDWKVIFETPHPITKYTPKSLFFNFWADPTHVKPYSANELEQLFFANGFSTIYKWFDQTNFVEFWSSLDTFSFLKQIIYKLWISKSVWAYIWHKIADMDDFNC